MFDSTKGQSARSRTSRSVNFGFLIILFIDSMHCLSAHSHLFRKYLYNKRIFQQNHFSLLSGAQVSSNHEKNVKKSRGTSPFMYCTVYPLLSTAEPLSAVLGTTVRWDISHSTVVPNNAGRSSAVQQKFTIFCRDCPRGNTCFYGRCDLDD